MDYSLGLSGEDLVEPILLSGRGVGLLRSEYVLRRHAAYTTVERGRNALSEYVAGVCQAYNGSPVWYRLAELDVEEVKVLEGCDDFELADRSLVTGTRGIRRAMLHPEAFELELATITAVSTNFRNLGIVLPFVAHPVEAAWAMDSIRRAGFSGRLACMAETPAAVVCLGEIIERGIDRVILGMNDLSALTMATSRGSGLYESVTPGIRAMVQLARDTTRRLGVELAMAGYLTQDLIDLASELKLDEAVVHYCDLPRLLSFDPASLSELDRMADIKRWTRAAIRERRAREGIEPVDPY